MSPSMAWKTWRLLAATIGALAFSFGGAIATPYLVVDAESGQALIENESTAPWFPASVTKLMTTYVALSAVRDGKLTMDTPLTMSLRASRMAPSKMGFRPGTEVTLDNALKMLMVKSPNDVAVMVAEGISGSVEAFADEMNAAGLRLGLKESHFVNPNGLHDPNHYSSARDMAIIGRALFKEFPDHADLFDIGAIQLGNQIIPNHNGLLGRYPGADGMKTGFTCPAGWNVVASATRNGRQAHRGRDGLPLSPRTQSPGLGIVRPRFRRVGRRRRAGKPADLERRRAARHARRNLLAPQPPRGRRSHGGGGADIRCRRHCRRRPADAAGCRWPGWTGPRRRRRRRGAPAGNSHRPSDRAGSLRTDPGLRRPETGLDRPGARGAADGGHPGGSERVHQREVGPLRSRGPNLSAPVALQGAVHIPPPTRARAKIGHPVTTTVAREHRLAAIAARRSPKKRNVN